MDCKRIGNLIQRLRKEKGLTQKQLADIVNISDKTISKWERGAGCPDVSLLNDLSNVLGVSVEKLLSGSIHANDVNIGNMKKIRFYMCPICGNILTSIGESDMSCCGRKLDALVVQPADEDHMLQIENIEDDYYITFGHEMCKKHFISFFALVRDDRVQFFKLYPEQGGELRFPRVQSGKLYYGCNRHGLREYKQSL